MIAPTSGEASNWTRASKRSLMRADDKAFKLDGLFKVIKPIL